MREHGSFPYALRLPVVSGTGGGRLPVGLGIFVCQVAKTSRFHGGGGGHFSFCLLGEEGTKGVGKALALLPVWRIAE